jgi:hypothetical protein
MPTPSGLTAAVEALSPAATALRGSQLFQRLVQEIAVLSIAVARTSEGTHRWTTVCWQSA